MKSHATQLDGGRFRILAAEPTRITKLCKSDVTKVATIQGVHILELDDTCPEAHTMDHLFVRNPNFLSSQELIALPLIQDPTKWFESLNQDLKGIRLEDAFNQAQEDFPGSLTMAALKRTIRNATEDTYRQVLDYIQLGLTGLALLFIIYKICVLLRGVVRKFTRRFRRPLSTPVNVVVDTRFREIPEAQRLRRTPKRKNPSITRRRLRFEELDPVPSAPALTMSNLAEYIDDDE